MASVEGQSVKHLKGAGSMASVLGPLVLWALWTPMVSLADPCYSVRLAIDQAQICGDSLDCAELPCTIQGVSALETIYLTVIVNGESPFLGAYWGLDTASQGSAVFHIGMFVCEGFQAMFGPPPHASATMSATGCKPGCTAIANHQYLVVSPEAVSWSLTGHANLGYLAVVDCDQQIRQVSCWPEPAATMNTSIEIECDCASPSAARPTRWGSLKALYR
jgi:hypothetical protein